MSDTQHPPSVVGSAIRYWWLVIPCILFGAAGGLLLSKRQETVVPARGRIVLSDLRTPNFDATDSITVGRVRVAEEALLASSRPVFEAAAAAAGTDYAAMRATVKAGADEDGAAAVVVDGRAPTTADSVKRVNAVIAAYREAATARFTTRADGVVGQVQTDLEATEARLAVLQTEYASLAPEDPLRADIQREISILQAQVGTREQKLTSLTSTRDLTDFGIAFENLAEGASGPAEPNTRRNTAFGAGLGLLMGIGTAWSVADRRQRPAAAESNIPVVDIDFSSRLANEAVPMGTEALAGARTALAYAVLAARNAGRSGELIAVTTATEKERASSTAFALATAAATAGQRVLVVNARGAAPGRATKAGALADAMEPGTAVSTAASVTTQGGESFEFVQLANTPAENGRLLRAQVLVDRLEDLRQEFDVILLLLPPMSDGGALAGCSIADAALIPSASGQIDTATSTVIAAGGSALGAVVRYRSRRTSRSAE